jgi:hypothetical protein
LYGRYSKLKPRPLGDAVGDATSSFANGKRALERFKRLAAYVR